jgi:hypothetical protein
VVPVRSNDYYHHLGVIAMSKKHKSKEKRGKKESLKAEAKKNSLTVAEEEKPFDFGGLPNRDLKKNLGCG